jgi:hypothetical protein
MNRLRAATLLTPDPGAASQRYVDWLDYKRVEEGEVGLELAESWGAPASAGKAFAVVQPASGAEIYLRFIQGETAPGYEPLKTLGWAAIEICNQDVMAVNERMVRSPFEIIGPPKLIEGLPTIHPMQVKGPDGEIVYLTEIKDLSEGSGLPKPASLIDHLFIMVLACSDMQRSAEWFCGNLGFTLDPPISLVYSMINDAFDLAPDAQHQLAMGGDGGDVFIEFDQYPSAVSPRPAHASELPPGIALCTVTHPNLDLIKAPWITVPAPRAGVVYKGRRSGVLRGPDDTLMEVVEA